MPPSNFYRKLSIYRSIMLDDRIRRKARTSFRTTDGWSSRGYLPHCDAPGLIQFVTIRAADSVPRDIQSALSLELEALRVKGVEAHEINRQRVRRIESLLDAGYGACLLATEAVAGVVIASLRIIAVEGHEILRWVVMPNHIHLLLKIRSSTSLSCVIRFFKARTGKQINKILGSSGRFWFPEYFDRYIRDSGHLDRVIRYIDQNPVRANLVESAENWSFGSVGYQKRLSSQSCQD